MSNNPKDLRKQLRNVVQEILPEVLTSELIAALKKEINAYLDKIDERQKNISSYIVRNSTK